MEHTCGFITLLNPHQAPVDDDDDAADSPFTSPRPPQPSSTPSRSSTKADASSLLSDSGSPGPANGITDKISAEMLASELDALDQSEIVNDSSKLDKSEGERSEGGERGKSEELVENDWQVLDLCFGIPLFNPSLNKDICQKIVNLKLFSENR